MYPKFALKLSSLKSSIFLFTTLSSKSQQKRRSLKPKKLKALIGKFFPA
jgi:hypothetical protein